MTINKKKFEVVEASIKDLHKAIKSGEITLVEVVQKYIDLAVGPDGRDETIEVRAVGAGHGLERAVRSRRDGRATERAKKDPEDRDGPTTFRSCHTFTSLVPAPGCPGSTCESEMKMLCVATEFHIN